FFCGAVSRGAITLNWSLIHPVPFVALVLLALAGLLTVAPGLDIPKIESFLIRVGLAELRGHQHVLARLVPEVVIHPRTLAPVLPPALDLKRPCVQDRETTRPVAVRIAQHAYHNIVVRHAVHCVWAGVASL